MMAVLMSVIGSVSTTVGMVSATELGLRLYDADDYQEIRNVPGQSINCRTDVRAITDELIGIRITRHRRRDD